MRYGIFADVHSNLEALDAVIEVFQKEAIDKYLCAGDSVGYAANPKECIEKIKQLSPILVAGNHDWASVNLFSVDYFNPMAAEAIFWTRQNLEEDSRYFLETLKLVYQNEILTLVHSTLDNPQDFNYMSDGYIAWETFKILKTDVCFVGHTHTPGMFIKDNDEHLQYREDDFIEIKNGFKYIINVGSVGQPRDGNPQAAYCIYDTDKKEIRIKRIDYNIELTRKKIMAAGLSRSLADRLLAGR